MTLSRRDFLKVSGITGGTLAAASQFFQLETLATAGPEMLQMDEKFIPTTCWIGKQDCGMLARVVNGRVVKLEGHPANPRNRGTLCPKGIGQIMSFYDPNRVKAPLMRTNEKGVPGEWEQVSWEDALSLVAEKMNAAREKGGSKFVWQKGRSKAKKFYDKAFVAASGALKLHHGAFCSDAGYRALEYTIGMHGVLHPDFKHTRYLLAWGWNVTNAGGNKFCWLTWPQQLVEAKERGLKMVAIDPRQRSSAHFANDWVPIKPGTDLVLALALCNLLIENGTLDRPYLTKYTNAPFLVGKDGLFLKTEPASEEEEGTPLVWDEISGSALPYDTEGIQPALEGTYTVDGVQVSTSFELFKAHVAEYTPARAAEVCGIEDRQVIQLAQDIGDNAMIGSMIEVDGHLMPYRPVAIMAYHMAQQELGFQTLRAMLMVMMLIGSVGAVGGTFSDFTWKEYKNWAKFAHLKVQDETNIYLKDSKYYPINSNNSSMVAKVINDPGQYDLTEDIVPEVVILHHVNPLGSFPDRDENFAAYQKIDFVAAIDPWISRTADYFADVILPAATIEKYEGPISATDQYIDAETLRLPPMDPLFQSKGDIDIYLDLCEAAGILYGEEGYLAQVNGQLKLEGEFALPLDQKPAIRDIFDRWAKAQGLDGGIEFFEKNHVNIKGPISPTKRYPYAMEEPFAGILPHRFYGESLLVAQQEMQELGADEIYWRDYIPFPAWRELTASQSPADYDMDLISYHMIEFKQSRTPVPLLIEMAPKQFAEINPKTAKAKGIADGDEIEVESQNALTNETRKVKVVARYREGIRPDVIAMPHHYGEYVKHPWTKGHGPSPNALFFTGEGYVAQTADQTYLVKVKVTKA
ncbi:MAG: molybdopterin-dependent oxidoreductase [Anaerolineales bacterium]